MGRGHMSKNRRVARLYGRKNAAIAAFLWPNQGLRSLILASVFPSLQGPSWYTWIQVFSSEYSSDVRKGLGSMYFLEAPLLGIQEMQIYLPENEFN